MCVWLVGLNFDWEAVAGKELLYFRDVCIVCFYAAVDVVFGGVHTVYS